VRDNSVLEVNNETRRCLRHAGIFLAGLRPAAQKNSDTQDTAGAATHHPRRKGRFVPANVVIEGLTPEQAKWTDDNGNHSIGQLTVHLIFWNQQPLAKMKGEPPANSGNNHERFNSFDAANWAAAVKQLDDVLTALEKTVRAADDAKFNEWASNLAHIGTRNAYHTGQILHVRKLQGSWNPEKGAK
jgi:hypothetical protein